jgi:tetratricopeptide (TPR) repeat protein
MRAALTILISVSMCIASAAAQEHQHGGGGQLGTVDFQTTCDKPLKAEFNRAVALLHSFEYDEARDAFTALAKKDGDCAMAYWGIAMTRVHGLWGEIKVKEGREAATAAQQTAAKYPKTSAREKAYIDAVATIYEGDDTRFHDRMKKFSDAMAGVHEKFPDDPEAAIFYALSLDESAPIGDKTYANERKCGEILEPLFAKMPNHPGIAHYLIHCYDNEVLAPKGLAAAREYAKIAPASSHAQHMPSHIFVRLGLWQETVEGNIGAMQAAENDKAASECEARGNEMHAMHFLQFGYLQQGKLKQAREIALRSRTLPPVKTECYVTPDFVAASFALDAHDWELARQLKPMANAADRRDVITWIALGIGSAKGGDVKKAHEVAAEFDKMRDDVAKKSPMGARNGGEVARLEVAGFAAEAEGDHAKAAEMLRAAADLSDSLGWAAWTMPPAREMLGDLLLEQKQYKAALEAYEVVLKREPRLFNPLYGAARAADGAGDKALAQEYRERLKQLAAGGDRPELAQLR